MKNSLLSRIIVIGLIALGLYVVVDVVLYVDKVAGFFIHPWSSIQGKTPPKAPAAPTVPIPDYPKASFAVLDSGFLAAEDENYWWIDNDRVMFKGYEAGTFDPDWEKKSSEERLEGEYDLSRPLKSGFYIWDVRKNTVTLFRRNIVSFCYEDGEAYFKKLDKNPEASVYMRGPLGKEKEIPGMKYGDWPDNRSFKKYPCWFDAKLIGKGMFALRKGWGVLAIQVGTPQEINEPVLLVPPEGDSIALPMKRGKWGRAIYAPWRDQYLLIDGSGSISKMPEIWWLSRDGRTESITLPHTGYATASFYPVKPGIFMLGSSPIGARRNNQYFLLSNDGSVLSIDSHYFGSSGISPDGCKIAYQGRRCEYLPENRTYPPDYSFASKAQCFTAQMIDFCQKVETK